MTFTSKRDRWKKILRNALVLGGISMITNWLSIGDMTLQSLWQGLLTGALVALIEIKYAYNIFPTLRYNKKAQKSFFL